MPVLKVQELNNNWKRTIFEPTVLMSTYLLAFAVCDYSNVSKMEDVQHNVWSRHSQINQTKFALNAAPLVLKHFTKMFNYSFPLPKLDMIAIPDFAAGAMENWGLVTFREVDLLLNEDGRPTMMTKMRVARIIAHELAHQWFGNLVTMKWWDSIWLNEGFADYVSFEAAQQVLSEWPGEMDIQFVYEQVQMAMSQDELPTSPPIHRTTEHTDLHLYFDYITYKKGSSIIRMLHKVLQSLFEKGLSAYMATNAFGNVDDDDLWQALQKAVDKAEVPPLDWNRQKLNVSAFMNNWINVAGFPVVIVTRVNDSVVKLSQKRSLSNLYESEAKHSTDHQWYIPLWYVTCNDDKQRFVWLQPNRSEFLNISRDCEFLANVGVCSFVRVLYPHAEMPTNFLDRRLMKNIDPINRAQLIDDAFSLAKANLTSYEQSLDVPLLLLENNSHPVPLKAAFLGYEFLNTMFSSSPVEYQLLTDHVSKHAIRYSKTFWELAAGSYNFSDHTRSEFLIEKACRWNVSECINDAKSEFDKFVSSCRGTRRGTTECSPVQPALRKTVYCVGVRVNESSFDELWKWCQQEHFNLERNNLVAGLSCTTQPASLHRLLNASLYLDSDCIKLQDVNTLFYNINANPLGRSLLWTFMQTHWREYMEKDMKNFLRTLASQSVSTFNTQSDVEKIEEFLSRPEVTQYKTFFAKPFESVKANKLWKDRYFDVIVDWLKKH
ncbi:hypothetical protein M514_06803, partial [Trichuris suis]